MTPIDRLRSAHYGLWLRLSERLGRVRGPRPETPAGSLASLGLDAGQHERIAGLVQRHGWQFETDCEAGTALENYARLELLERAGAAFGDALPQGRVVHDVGSASFWYAAALHAAFRPAALTGFEIEGYRRLKGGINRAERAQGYVRGLPGTEFVIADYALIARPAGLVTAFFPFVTPAPVLAWRLPLAVLAPQRLFARIRANLGSGGEFWMVNHGTREAEVAAAFAGAAGLVRAGEYLGREPLVPRPEPAVVSRWTAAAGEGAAGEGAPAATVPTRGTPPPPASAPP